MHTPWGPSQGVTKYSEGVEFHTTSSHGGFKLDRIRNEQVAPAWRSKSGWYEEDCEANIVAFTFSDIFKKLGKGALVECAKEALIHWFPDQWESVTGEAIAEGASLKRDEALFKQRHRNDWVVISALNVDGAVRCVATVGGQRGVYGAPDPKERIFLVPVDEYRSRKHDFVIDETRHIEVAKG